MSGRIRKINLEKMGVSGNYSRSSARLGPTMTAYAFRPQQSLYESNRLQFFARNVASYHAAIN